MGHVSYKKSSKKRLTKIQFFNCKFEQIILFYCNVKTKNAPILTEAFYDILKLLQGN